MFYVASLVFVLDLYLLLLIFFLGEMLLLLLLVAATSDYKRVEQRASKSENVVGKIIWRLVWPSLTRDVGDEWEEDEEKY